MESRIPDRDMVLACGTMRTNIAEPPPRREFGSSMFSEVREAR